MKLEIAACLHSGCDFTCYVRRDNANVHAHTAKTGHRLLKTFPIPPGVLLPTAPILFERIRWEVEEATQDSAVMNNYVDGTQTVAVRVIITRKMVAGTQ